MLGNYSKYSIIILKSFSPIYSYFFHELLIFYPHLKRYSVIILLFLCFYHEPIFAQEYQITNVPVFQYSIDRYTDEIYYQNYLTGKIYKTNSTGTQHTLTEFPSVPQFSNNNHTAAFIENNNLYLHDFGKDTSYFLDYLPFSYYLLFSPSDTKIVYGGGCWSSNNLLFI